MEGGGEGAVEEEVEEKEGVVERRREQEDCLDISIPLIRKGKW